MTGIRVRLYKRGPAWWGRWTENAVTKRRTTGCSDKTAARTIANQWEVDAADPRAAMARVKTLADARTALLEELRMEGAPWGTQNMYEYKCKPLVDGYTRNGRTARITPQLADITVAVVDEYFATRRAHLFKEERPHSWRSTLNKEWVALSRMLKLARRRGWFAGDVEDLKPEWLTVDYHPRETYLPLEDMIKLVDAINHESYRAAVALMFATGMRTSEAKAFLPEDVDRETWRVRIRGTKTAKSARTIIVPIPFRSFFDYVAGPLAIPTWKYLQRACVRAGVTRVSPNDVRRSFASFLVQHGVPLDVVARLLGHTSTAMVFKTYGKHTPDTLATIVDRAVPLVYQPLRLTASTEASTASRSEVCMPPKEGAP